MGSNEMVSEAKVYDGETLLVKRAKAAEVRIELAAVLGRLDRLALLLPAAHVQAALDALDDKLRQN